MKTLTTILSVCVLMGALAGCTKSSTAATGTTATVTGVATASKVAVVTAK